MLRATIDNRAASLEVVDYTVNQSVNSPIPGDMSGGTSDGTITVRANEDGSLLKRYLSCVDQVITLYDTDDIEGTAFMGRGVWSGVISKASRTGARITFTVDSLLTKLNVIKTATPFFGLRSAGLTTYGVNWATNPSFEVNATSGTTVQAGTGGTAALTNPSVGTAFRGAKVARVTWSVAATGVGGATLTVGGLTGDTTYSFGVEAMVANQQHLNVAITWLDASSAPIGSAIVGDDFDFEATTWQALTAQSLVSPTLATQAQIRIQNQVISYGHNWAISDRLDLDGVMINLGDTLLPYDDGDTAGNFWNGTTGLSSSTIAITDLSTVGAYDATFANAFRYYCSLVGIDTTSITIDSALENIYVAYPRWTGNVLDHIKMMCQAQGVVFYINNANIQVTKGNPRTIRIENQDAIAVSVSAQGTSRSVQVTNYNNQWLTDYLALAPDQVYSVNAGGITQFQLTTEHSIIDVNNPVCVSEINPQPYLSGTGQYVVVDSNNHIVDPTAWNKAKGFVTATIDPSDNSTITVTIGAPPLITGYVGPYRLAMNASGTGNDVSSLFITGSGVFIDRELVEITTGATVSETTQDQLPVVDNIFLSDPAQAHDRGTFAADDSGGALVTASGTFGFDPDSDGQEFGRIAAGRYYTNDQIFRFTDVTVSRSGVQFNARMDVRFDDLTDLFAMIFNEFNAIYAGNTFTAFNALFTGQTFAQFNAVSSNPTFDTLNGIYDGASFNDHAVYPYMKGVITDDTEAAF